MFDIPTRWGDMDAQAHVNNATFVEYLQEARAELLLAGPNAHLMGGGVVVVGHQVEFLRSVTHGEPMAAHVAIDQVGAARFSLGYELRVGDQVAVRARTVLCPCDLQDDRVRRLTPAERDHFVSLQGEFEPLRELPKLAAADHAAHEHPIRVRWGDLDSYGHVNNVRAYDYVQEARIAMMNSADPDTVARGDRQPGHLWLVVRQDVHYLAQMRFRRDPYVGRTVVAKIGATSMTLACDIADPETGQVFQRARSVLVCADPQGRPTPVPARLRERVAPWTL